MTVTDDIRGKSWNGIMALGTSPFSDLHVLNSSTSPSTFAYNLEPNRACCTRYILWLLRANWPHRPDIHWISAIWRRLRAEKYGKNLPRKMTPPQRRNHREKEGERVSIRYCVQNTLFFHLPQNICLRYPNLFVIFLSLYAQNRMMQRSRMTVCFYLLYSFFIVCLLILWLCCRSQWKERSAVFIMFTASLYYVYWSCDCGTVRGAGRDNKKKGLQFVFALQLLYSLFIDHIIAVQVAVQLAKTRRKVCSLYLLYIMFIVCLLIMWLWCRSRQ